MGGCASTQSVAAMPPSREACWECALIQYPNRPIDQQLAACLNQAACAGHIACVHALLASGADVNMSPDGRSPLHSAAGNGEAEAVAVLLAAGADVNARDGEGRTPLHWAAENGHRSCVRRLIAAGAAASARDGQGRTALQWAAAGGHSACMQQLLAATPADGGASVDRRGGSQQQQQSEAAQQQLSTGGARSMVSLARVVAALRLSASCGGALIPNYQTDPAGAAQDLSGVPRRRLQELCRRLRLYAGGSQEELAQRVGAAVAAGVQVLVDDASRAHVYLAVYLAVYQAVYLACLLPSPSSTRSSFEVRYDDDGSTARHDLRQTSFHFVDSLLDADRRPSAPPPSSGGTAAAGGRRSMVTH